MEGEQTHSQSEPLHGANNRGHGDGPGRRQTSLVVKAKEKFSPGIKIGLILALVVYLALLIVGAYGVNKCPVEDNIPLFLIATGGIGLFSKSMTYIREHIMLHLDVKYIETSMYSVETVFFILGSYWVYKEYPPSYDPSSTAYCNKTVYLFAFVYLSTLYAIAVAVLSGFACFLICICFLKSVDTEVNVEAGVQTTDTENVETRQQETV
ncbi:hypothetical protein NQ318_008829 [Aromia moschata]|uniref:Uncharacterized protein n=1 Tax=Aromia moschata TaxID=1265417 RepID=A0AAV8ZA95_9CUCU|nr:hypothetical protein NQ318_008829 [Aromia moschata]